MAASGLSKTKAQEMKAQEAKEQLQQWVKPHDFKLNKGEYLLAMYESPALGGVVAFIMDKNNEYLLVKFEFKENEMTRTDLATVHRLNELVKYYEKLAATPFLRCFEMVSNRLLIHVITSVGQVMEQHVISFDLNGVVCHEVSSNDKIFEDLCSVHLVSSTSYLARYWSAKDQRVLFKLHNMESKEEPKQVASERSPYSSKEVRRLSNGVVYYRQMIHDRDLKLKGAIPGQLLCETRQGYLVLPPIKRQMTLKLYDKESLKPLKEVVWPPFFHEPVAVPNYACQQANGNIVVLDTRHYAWILDADLNSLLVQSDAKRYDTLQVNDGLPFGSIVQEARKELLGNPVRFFSDRRHWVDLEREKLFKNYFNFLFHILPPSLLRIVFYYNELDFTYLIDEAVKSRLLNDIPPAEVIADAELGELQLRSVKNAAR